MSFMVNPYRFATGGGAPPTTIGISTLDTPTVTPATIQSTSTTLTGVTPAAAFLVGSHHRAANDPGETAHAQIMFSSIANTQYVAWTQSEDNLASTDCNNNSAQQAIALQNDAGGVTNPISNAESLISGGFEVGFATSNVARRVMGASFAGTGVQANNGIIALGTGTSAISVNVGFQPQAVIVYGVSGALASSVASCRYSFGIALASGTQRSVAAVELDNQAAGSPQQTLYTTNVGGQLGTYTLTAGGFSGTGFQVTPSASAGSDDIFYLALAGYSNVALVDFTTPTSTGSAAITGAGFTPQYALIVLTNLEVVNTIAASSDLQSGFSIGMVNPDDEWSTSIRIDSGADPTDTASNCKNVAILGASATNTAAISATLVSFDSDGMTLNWTAVQATGKKGFVLFIG
jgi:hypothetical protein